MQIIAVPQTHTLVQETDKILKNMSRIHLISIGFREFL